MGGVWNEMKFRVPPNPNHSVMILCHIREVGDEAAVTRLLHFSPLIKEGVLRESNKDLQDPGIIPR